MWLGIRQAPGTDVTVIGRVVVPSETFSSSILDAGFALNDRTRGIFVCTNTEFERRIGRDVEETGTRGSSRD